MSCLGNLLWIIFGGFLAALGWFLAGLLLCITIVGIPFGRQCFKMARLQLAPFGKDIVQSRPVGVFQILGNIIWILVCGWEICLANLVSALLFAITIVGIPFALQNLKMARLALWPFGAEII